MNLRNLKSMYDDWGFWKAVYYYLMRAQQSWLCLCYVQVRPLTVDQEPISLTRDRVVRIVSQQELHTFADSKDLDLSGSFIEQALYRGDLCVAVFENEQIISYRWFANKTAPHMDGLWTEVGEGVAYGYKAYTTKDCRNQGLQTAIGAYSDKLLLDLGKTHMAGFVETHNFWSLSSEIGKKHTCQGYVGYIKIFGKALPFRSPLTKKFGFRFYLPA